MSLPAASFPAAIVATPGEINTSFDNAKTYAGVVPSDYIIPGAYLNQLAVEIKAIETTLGINPHGALADLVTRLAVAINTDGTLKGAGARFVFNGIVSPAALAGNTNDYDPAGTGVMTAINVLRISAGGAYDLTGLLAGSSGQVVLIHNVGANAITLKDESTNSSAANRFALTADLSMVRDQVAIVQYDTTDARWRCIGGAGGSGGAPSGSASGDLAGTYPGPTVAQSSTAFALAGVNSPASIGADQNDYNPASLSTANVLRLSSSLNVNITGLAGGAAGRLMVVRNVGSFTIVLKSQSASSSAANRFAFLQDVTLNPDGEVWLWYDSTSTRWTAAMALEDINGKTANDVDILDFISNYDYSAAANRKYGVDRLLGFFNDIIDGRLTLTSATPVTTNDVTGATTIYFSPYAGNRMVLFDGTRWVLRAFSEIAIALGTLTSGKNYDVFAFTSTATPSSTNTATDVVTWGSAPGWATGSQIIVDATVGGLTAGTTYFYNAASSTTGSFHTTLANALAGTSKVDLTANITQNVTAVSLEFSAAWSSNTARTDALALQDGVNVKSGTTTRRYLGTFRTTATTTTEDSAAKRFVWNAYNQVQRNLFYGEQNAGGSQTNVAAGAGSGFNLTQLNSTYQVEVVTGLDGSVVDIVGQVSASNSTVPAGFYCGIGVGSATNTPALSVQTCTSANNAMISVPVWCDLKTAGYQIYYLSWSMGTGTGTAVKDFGGGVGETYSGDPYASWIKGMLNA